MPATLTRSVSSDRHLKAKPLLKWPGGKRQLLKYLVPLLPKKMGRYHEPFFGGGALFFAVQPPSSILSDTNSELINCYRCVRNQPEQLIAQLVEWENSQDEYTRIREWQPQDVLERAARLIYLTRLSFNGIYRLNSRGEFNVPYGQRTHLPTCDPEQIRAISTVLASCRIQHEDFADVERRAEPGDVVYFDPPYVLPDDRSRFVRYNGPGRDFSWKDQIRLAHVADRLAAKGVRVIVSNANHPRIRALYPTFTKRVIDRSSTIAADGSVRRMIKETIFYSRPHAPAH